MTDLITRKRRASVSSRTLVVLFAVLLIGAPLASIPASAQEEGLVGDYTVTITREDIPFEVPAGGSYLGRWRVAFSADGTYLAERQDIGEVVSGTYEVSGSKVTITDDDGLLSCASPSSSTVPGADATSGEYEWAKEGQSITFVPVEDHCGGRQILLSTRPLTTFLACETEPLGDMPSSSSSESDATPTADDVEDAEDEPLAVLTPDAESATPTATGSLATEDNMPVVEEEIDNLLLQMTACWATGEPDRWLPLLSTDFRDSLVNSADDFEETLGAAMVAPIVWERAGDLDIESETEVSGIVKSTVGQEDDFQRFSFVLEDGEWKWNG